MPEDKLARRLLMIGAALVALIGLTIALDLFTGYPRLVEATTPVVQDLSVRMADRCPAPSGRRPRCARRR